MPPAEGAAVGQKNPVDRLFDCVPHADASQIDRSAIRTARGEHQTPVLAALPVEVADALRNPCPGAAAVGCTLPLLIEARLASRAASICSGVRTSGSESFTLLRSRETCRLWRLANLLSIPQQYTLVEAHRVRYHI